MADKAEAARSVAGARWVAAGGDARVAAGLVQETGMPQALANILASRGVSRDGVGRWLDPKIRDLMPDPSTLTDMDAATGRLAEAVRSGERIGVFGDYDVDGACSAALLHGVLTALGAEVSVHIPDRFDEGYGPNLPAMMALRGEGCGLIVTVDCGITANRPVEAAVEAGADVVIIDHHVPGPELPRVTAAVNPNRLEDDGGLGNLAAAGVCFMVMAGLLRRLRREGHFDGGRAEPDLMRELDIVALATVADIVPLTGLNRALVRSGLAVMGRRGRPGLAALADAARLGKAPDVHALGFILGPRINAAGRIGDSSRGESRLGVDLLVERDAGRAQAIALRLEKLNEERREIDRRVSEEAIAALDASAGGDPFPAFVLAAGEGWNEGVVGIAASRVRDHANRPAAVVSLREDAGGRMLGRGSARSIAPFKLGEAVLRAVQAGLLVAGGGHDMAAGFTLDPDRRGEFEAHMAAAAGKAFGPGGPPRETRVDTTIAAGHCTTDLLDWLDQAGPWGRDFPEAVFMIEGATLAGMRKMGGDGAHRGFGVRDATGRVDGVAFRVAGTPLAGALDGAGGDQRFDCVGRLARNRHGGRNSAQFILADLRPAAG